MVSPIYVDLVPQHWTCSSKFQLLLQPSSSSSPFAVHICLETSDEPLERCAGHIFCNLCTLIDEDTRERLQECPLCLRKIDWLLVRRNPPTWARVGKLR